MLFVSPKSEDTILIVPNYHVFAVSVPNLLCIFLHLVSPLPEAAETARGYLHGGVMVDFVGQKPPSSRFSLILLDLVVLALQCFMITVNIDKERIRKTVGSPQSNASSGVFVGSSSVVGQDYDAEERGVLRDAPIADDTNYIELRPLRNPEDRIIAENGQSIGGDENSQSEGGATRRSSQLEGLADLLRSGNAILADFHVPQSLRTAWHSRQNTAEHAAAYALQNVGYSATRAALAAQRRARLASTQRRP